MRRIIFLFFLIFGFIFFNPQIKGDNKENLLKGRLISPVINDQGELQFLYRNQESKINLATHGLVYENKEGQDLPQCDGICSSVIKKDKNKRIHLLWVVNKDGESEVFSGLFENFELSESSLLYRDEGTVHSPDFCFDRSNYMWSSWIFHHESNDRVVVKDKFRNQHWVIDTSCCSEIQGPKILADVENRIWVFWTGTQKGREEVFFSFYDGNDWSNPGRINESDQYPHIFLDVEIGPDGRPWLVWSAYDGEDYEIYESHWTLFGWSKEEQITDNLDGDLYPDMSLIWGHIPMIVWSRWGGKKSGVFCKYKETNQWTPEIRLVNGDEKFINSPQVVTDQGRVGLVWESDRFMHSKIFHFSDLIGKNQESAKKINREIIMNPSLQDNVYIGFGDSITYGYINSTPVPDKGYIPILEEKLNSAFGISEVINEGYPGERTLGGLNRIRDVLAENEGRYLLLMEGTNDVITNSITMDSAAFNLEEMAKICLDFGVLPLISTIIPRDDIWWYIPFFKERLLKLNEKIRKIPGELRIPFIDMFNEFYYYQEGELDWRSLLSQDGLHPNEQGYKYMAEKWFDQIEIFPFPPSIIEGKRVFDETLFDSELGNLIKWQENPKLSYKNIFKGYKVYRRNDSGWAGDFQEVAFLPALVMVNYKQYFDKNISPGQNYSYTVCLVRRDDVEGPCSNVILVGSLK